MTYFLSACFSMLTLALLAGCSGVGLFSGISGEQMDRMEADVALCASGQVENQQQLQRQLDQLELQGQKLDAISEAQTAGVMGAAEAQASVDDASCAGLSPEPSKLIVGRHEQVWLEDIQLALPARVDTGAETASLDARNIELFERNGKRWVRFEIVQPDSGEALQLERRLKRIASIVQSNTSEPERRPVIKLGITVGHISQSAEFTLSNRSHLDYQVLIGRNILKDVMIVDVSKINAASAVGPE